ncbi:MAG: LPP20 family lipoprotein, partial [Candidatus Sericytochromatia bacterium]
MKIFFRLTHPALLALSAAAMLAGPALAVDSYVVQRMPSGTIDWANRWVEATGSGVPRETGNPAQARLLAQRAAVADAYRQLAETVHGVRIDAETTVLNYVTQSDVIRTRVQALIKGARQVGEARQGADGVTQVTMRLPLYGADQLSGAIELDQQVRRQQSALPGTSLARLLHESAARLPEPFFPMRLAAAGFAPIQLAAGPAYTGLVLDMCTMPIQPVMSPAVFGNEQQVYIANYPIDPDQVIAEGVLQYYGDY